MNKKRLTRDQFRDMTREFLGGEVGTRMPMSQRNLLNEMNRFSAPPGYYDPPEGEEIPDDIYDDLEAIFERAATSPDKKHQFKGLKGYYTLEDNTVVVGDALPFYTLKGPGGLDEDFYVEDKTDIGRLEDQIIDILMQNYTRERDEYDQDLRDYAKSQRSDYDY